LLYESNAHALGLFGETTASLDAALQRSGYLTYFIEACCGLVPTDRLPLRVHCVRNCLAAKGELPDSLRSRVGASVSHEAVVQEIVETSRSPYSFDRLYLVHALADAGPEILSEARVRRALRLLAEDPDESVRQATTLFAVNETLAASGSAQ
jgi:hypothetical protein